MADLTQAYFVDCGLTYDGASTNVVTGLHHLVGESVVALIDGAVHDPVTVAADGSVTFDFAGTTIHVGLAYDCDLEFLPLAYEAAAFGQGVEKNVNTLKLRVNSSAGVFAGPSYNDLRELPSRLAEAYGDAPDLKTGIVEIGVDPQWSSDGRLVVRQSDPLPLTILAALPEFVDGDN